MDQLSLCTPTGLASADVGGDVFNLWMEEEEEQWHIGQKLLSSCPAEFLCPISLDVMTEPVILAETGMTYDRAAIRRWFLLGGDTCPLTGLRLTTTKVLTHKQLQARIERWVAGRGLIATEEVPSCDALNTRLCQDSADSSCAVAAHAESATTPAAAIAAGTGFSAVDPSAFSKQTRRDVHAPGERLAASNRRARLEANMSRGSFLLRALSNGTLALLAPAGSSSRGRSPALTPSASPRPATGSPRPEASGSALRRPGLAGGEGPAGRIQDSARQEELPRASPGSSISLENPIFQQGVSRTRTGQHARLDRSVSSDRTGLCLPVQGGAACRSRAAEACQEQVRRTGLWQAQSSAVQAAIEQHRSLAAVLESPETLPLSARPVPPSDRLQEHANCSGTPEQNPQAAAGAARSTAPDMAKGGSRSRAKSSSAKRKDPKGDVVRKWWEPPKVAGGEAGGADKGRVPEVNCTLSHTRLQPCAASGHHAVHCTQDRPSPPPTGEAASARQEGASEHAERPGSAGSAASRPRYTASGKSPAANKHAPAILQLPRRRQHREDAGPLASTSRPALSAALLQWMAFLRRVGTVPAAPQELAALRTLGEAGGRLFRTRCFGCSGWPAVRELGSGTGLGLTAHGGGPEDDSEDEVITVRPFAWSAVANSA